MRRYSTGVWYDPWMDPCWGWRRSAWWGPSWYAWGPTWGWSYAWGYPAGWYYSYGWSPSWGYYADPYWSYYYGGYPVGGSTSSYRSNYRPRTYTAPSGGTVYTPPRGTIQSSSPTPPRRTNALPSYSRPGAGGSTIPSGGTYSPSGGRPSMSGGGTGGGIRSSGSGGVRPR
uniref:Uncharacterized protein n=1 Tax=uncultured Bacteroidota bacterium TaxID=152509 RepID=H5SK44_9BACT|nr:hypothetical protein HGMM_F40B03C18 [uncultured Bacteroidetes bacterium]